MRVDDQNRLLLRYNELVPSVFKKSTYSAALKRGGIKTTHRGGYGRPVEIIFEKCKFSYQKKIVQRLGNPYILVKQEKYQMPNPEEAFIEKLKKEAENF